MHLAQRMAAATIATLLAIGALGVFQGPRPAAAATWQNLIYVANRADSYPNGSISVVNPTSQMSVVSTIALPGWHPRELAITPDGRSVYATTTEGPVIPVDTGTNTVGASINSDALRATWGIAASRDGKTVYAADGLSSNLVPIDTATHVARAPISIINAATDTNCPYADGSGVAITPDGTTAYVAISARDMVARVDLASSTVTGRITVRCPVSVTVTTGGDYVYVGSTGSGLVTVIANAATPTVVAQATGPTPYGMAAVWDRVFIAGYTSGGVYIAPIPNAGGPLTSVGGTPRGVAISPDGTAVFVSSAGVGLVRMAVNGTSQQAVPVGDTAYGVAIAPEPLTGSVAASGAVEGQAFSGTIASFTDPNTARQLSDFGALIDWGDGSGSSSGTVSGSGGSYTVSGTHSYAEEGAYQVKVQAYFLQSAPTTLIGTLAVGDAPLSATAAAGTTSPATSFSGTVATFTDADAAGTASDYHATILWGDGSTDSGTIAAGPSGFTVNGSHGYTTPPSRPISTHICDASACADAGPAIDHLGVTITSPAPAGVYPFATAEAYDASGAALGDVTASASFGITPDGSCHMPQGQPGIVCGSSIAGPHTVTATYGGKTGSASLQVIPGSVQTITLTALAGGPCNGQQGQQSCSVPSGTTVTYQAEGFDAYNNDVGDVTSASSFGIAPDGTCTGAACTAILAGAHTVTATDGSAHASLSVTVTPLSLDHLVLAPASASIIANGSQSYAATGYDKNGNSLGDVTSATTFTIATTSMGTPDGTCTGSTCTATTAVAHTVTGSDGGKTGTAQLMVTPGPVDHLALTPATASITAGGSQTYAATLVDRYGNTVRDVTASSGFVYVGSSLPVPQPCNGSSCGPTAADTYTITASYGTPSMRATGTLTVTSATTDHIVLSPASSTVTAGTPQTYAATAYDQYGNSLGDVTAQTTLSIAKSSDGTADGTCTGAVCSATLAVPHTVTGTDGSFTATAALAVAPAALDHITLAPASATITAGGSQTYAVTGYDMYGNSLGDVTAQTTFSIAKSSDGTADGTCTGATCTATLAVPHTVTAGDSGKKATASLMVTPAALDHLSLTPATSTISDGGSQTYSATGYDQYGNSRGDVTGATSFSITPDGWCTGTTCTPSHAGSHTVTGSDGAKTGTAALTVQQAQLVITASSASMTYADAVPAITPSYSGWVNGDGPTSLTTLASCSTTATSTSPAGAYPSSCSGAVDADYAITYKSGTVTVLKRSASLSYTGPLMVSTASASATSATVTLQALVTQQNDGYTGDITKATPVFLLYKSSNFSLLQADAGCTASTVTSAGVATCTVSALAADSWTVVVQMPSSNGYFVAAGSVPVVLTVYVPSTGSSATGGGWISDPSTGNVPVAVSRTNDHGNLGFTVRYRSGTTTLQGQSVYVFRGSDGYDYIVKSTSWQSGGFAVNANHASFAGKCNVTVVDPRSNQVVTGLGGGNFSYRIDVTDNSATGGTDGYALSVYDGTGTLYHQSGTAAAEIALGGGHVRVH